MLKCNITHTYFITKQLICIILPLIKNVRLFFYSFLVNETNFSDFFRFTSLKNEYDRQLNVVSCEHACLQDASLNELTALSV